MKSKAIHLIIGFVITVVLTLYILPDVMKNYTYMSIFIGCLYAGIMIGPRGYFYGSLLALLIVFSEFLSFFFLVARSFDNFMQLESRNILLKVYLIELAIGVLGGFIGYYFRTKLIDNKLGRINNVSP